MKLLNRKIMCKEKTEVVPQKLPSCPECHVNTYVVKNNTEEVWNPSASTGKDDYEFWCTECGIDFNGT